MKVKINGKDIFELSTARKKVLSAVQSVTDLEQFCELQMVWILYHKYERCLERMKAEWLPKLQARGITEVPIDDDQLCALIFAQSDYKCRRTREDEAGETKAYQDMHARLKPFHADLMGSSNDLNTMPPLELECEGKIVLKLSPIRQKVIMNDIHADIFYQDMCRRVYHILDHPFTLKVEELRKSMAPALIARGVQSIPLDNDAFAALVAESI